MSPNRPATGAPTFEHLSKLRPHLLRDGIKARAVNGDRVTMAVIDLEPNAISPEHRHENEQLGFVITGTLTMRIGSEKRELRPWRHLLDSAQRPTRGDRGPERLTATDIVAPVRADWADLKRGDPSPGNWP